MTQKRDWLKVNVESLLLNIISSRPTYGYQIIKELENRSKGYFKFKEGTLYPVLHRLERAGLIQGQWRSLSSGRQRKYYQITDKGLTALAARRSEWQDFLTAMNLVTQPLSR